MTRDELQGLYAHRLAKSKRLVCQWATGCGKSGVALRFLKDNPGMNCLILVPEQNNIDNWKEEFRKFGVPLDNVRIACYASFKKFQATRWDLLVLDEVPHVDTEKRLEVCRSVKGEFILALGAVVDDAERSSLESVYGQFENSVITLDDAVRMGILPAPSIRVLHLQMDKDTRRNYDVLEKAVTRATDAYNLSPSSSTLRMMRRAGLKRKRFLGTVKEHALQRVCDILRSKSRRFLCFCASIAQAERIGGEHAFTSKSAKSFRHLEKFNNHEIDSLYVVGKLIEGQNLQDIDCGVIAQLGGTERITVQEIGRIMRSDNPIIYVLVFDGTKDDGFLYTITSSMSNEYIKHYKF